MAQREENPEGSPLAQGFFLVLLLVGLLFYGSWGALYGSWTDLGVYSVTAVFVGFGLTGYLLYRPDTDAEAQE